MIAPQFKDAVTSLLWVEVMAPGVAKHWARTSRIMAGTSQPERDKLLRRLKDGECIDYEVSGISIKCSTMSASDRKRLEHLTNFEVSGFRLTSFRSDMALFYKNGQDYYCLREMVERGFLPTSAIAINQINAAVTTLSGNLIDVFVPVGLAEINFFVNDAHRP